jgi:hypothetical protein
MVAALLLTIGCMSVGHAAVQTDTSSSAATSVPAPVDEMTVSTTSDPTVRQRLLVARRRFPRSAHRVLRRVEPGRFAHWLLPVQLRLMPPAWRGPTVLRL